MTAIKRTRAAARGAWTAVALLAAFTAAGCGSERHGDEAGAAPTPSAVADVPCPGESTTAAPAHTAPAGDHYAENHGFRVPIALQGKARCEGFAAAKRIEDALEPLRKRGDFSAKSARRALTGLGYPEAKVKVDEGGPTRVDFLIDASRMCVEGSMNQAVAKAEAFGGYPDGTGCEPPRGGH
ncbi:hypothetical protein [Streptomyces caatingaensis]|nr:hypothetical protein [Streptomyces caatingaensis]